MDTELIIGSRLFTDCSTRPGYRDAEGQYVLDDAGGMVRGHWLLTEDDGLDDSDRCDMPLIVEVPPDRD